MLAQLAIAVAEVTALSAYQPLDRGLVEYFRVSLAERPND
jgi:hypothetical protein